MHISLTPTLEADIKNKVNSGLYNNASEVIREALRFMNEHDSLIEQMKMNHLRQEVSLGVNQAEQGLFSSRTVQNIISDSNKSLSIKR